MAEKSDSATAIRIPYQNLKRATAEVEMVGFSDSEASVPIDIKDARSAGTSLMSLILSCTVAAGVQFGWALQLSLLTPFVQTLGIGHAFSSFIWLCGPITSLVVQPCVGIRSDKCTSKYRRRRPFILAGSLMISVAAFPQTLDICEGIQRSTAEPVISLVALKMNSRVAGHTIGANSSFKTAALVIFAILGFPLSITYSVPYSVTAVVAGDSGAALGVLNLAVVVPQMVVSLVAGPWDALFGGGNIPAFVMALLAGVIRMLKLPNISGSFQSAGMHLG